MTKLPLLLLALAVPTWAQEDAGGGDEDAKPAATTSTTDDGGTNTIGISPSGPGFGQGSPQKRGTQPASLGSGGGGGSGGGSGGGGQGGTFGSRPTQSAYGGAASDGATGGQYGGVPIDVSKKKVLAVYPHHSAMPEKQMSYGIFRVRQYSDAYSIAFYTGKTGGRMEGHYCTIVRAATSPACTWQSWISEAPGGKALCGAAAPGDVLVGPPMGIVTPTYTTTDLKNFLAGGNKDLAKGADLKGWCLLKPSKTYYCNVSAAGFTGDKEQQDLAQFRPTSSNPCIGLKASSPYDTPEMAETWQSSRPR